MDKSFLSKQGGYLANKLSLSSGRVDHRHVYHLLNCFAPDNEDVVYHEILQQHEEDGVSKLVPGFKISIPLKNNALAGFLMNCVKDQKNLFPFDTSMNFNRNEDGTLSFDLCSQGDFTTSLRRPSAAVAVNMEMYLKYAAFRMVAQYIALNRMYDFGDESLNPVLHSEDALLKADVPTRLKMTQDTVLPKHPQIEKILKNKLTISDVTHCGTLFKLGRDELRLALNPKPEIQENEIPDLRFLDETPTNTPSLVRTG